MDTPPHYQIAIDQFRRFLSSQGLQTDFRWVWRDDIRSRRRPGSPKTASRPIYVRLDVIKRTDKDTFAEARYNAGLRRGFGIRIEVAFVAQGVPCCYIYLPADAEDASYRMTCGLCMSVPTPAPEAKVVKNKLIWNTLSLYVGQPEDGWLKYIPRREDAI